MLSQNVNVTSRHRDVHTDRKKTVAMFMPFGKYRGQPVSSLPTNYLDWLVENVDFESDALRDEIEAELSARYQSRRKPPPTPTPTQAKVKAWYRELALRFHPDRAGDDGRAMQTLNVAYERLCEILELPR